MNEFKDFILNSIHMNTIELPGIILSELEEEHKEIIEGLIANKQIIKVVYNDITYLLPYTL